MSLDSAFAAEPSAPPDCETRLCRMELPPVLAPRDIPRALEAALRQAAQLPAGWTARVVGVDAGQRPRAWLRVAFRLVPVEPA